MIRLKKISNCLLSLYSSLQLAMQWLTGKFSLLNGFKRLHFLKDQQWIGDGSNSLSQGLGYIFKVAF